MTTVATIDTSKVTNEQIGACTKVFDAAGKPFYKVVNSRNECDEAGHLIEYSVKAIFKAGKWHLTCDCKAGNEGRLCWHKRASRAAAAEEKQAMAEQVALNEAAKAKAKRPVVTLSQEELDRFYSCRPDWQE